MLVYILLVCDLLVRILLIYVLNPKTPQNHASILSYLLDNPDKEILLAKAIEKTQDIELMDAHRFGELLHLPEIYESYEYLTDQELPEGYLRVN